MINNEKLRLKARFIHDTEMIPYKLMATKTGVSQGTFSNWINEYFDFGAQRVQLLYEYLNSFNHLKEE